MKPELRKDGSFSEVQGRTLHGPGGHGGDLLAMAAAAGRKPDSLLDFSVNVRPEGPPEFLLEALRRAVSGLAAYPSPHAEEAVCAAARRHGLPADRFAFGNGSNELIHALARVLRKQGVPVVRLIEPTFSEYALACRLAGLPVQRIWGGVGNGIAEAGSSSPYAGAADVPALLSLLADLPSGAAVFLTNPGNPSGLFRSPETCLELAASRNDLLWIVDEAFIEYAGPEAEVSVLRRAPDNVVVLRSLTKFHAVPGVRLGYLAAPEQLIRAVRNDLPAWSVNAFALAAAVAALDDVSDFADRTREENSLRRADLAAGLRTLPETTVFVSAANYVLFRCAGAPPDLHAALLTRFGIALRDCSNYHGLEDGTWFRAAVRFPHEHRRLVDALHDLLRAPRK